MLCPGYGWKNRKVPQTNETRLIEESKSDMRVCTLSTVLILALRGVVSCTSDRAVKLLGNSDQYKCAHFDPGTHCYEQCLECVYTYRDPVDVLKRTYTRIDGKSNLDTEINVSHAHIGDWWFDCIDGTAVCMRGVDHDFKYQQQDLCKHYRRSGYRFCTEECEAAEPLSNYFVCGFASKRTGGTSMEAFSGLQCRSNAEVMAARHHDLPPEWGFVQYLVPVLCFCSIWMDKRVRGLLWRRQQTHQRRVPVHNVSHY
ncbi:MAG: hypothetical protein MHM6MM_006123 [Cercozoa sp. M6MM]